MSAISLYLAAAVRADRAAHLARMDAYGRSTGNCPYCGAKGKYQSDEKCGNGFRKSHKATH